MSKNTDYMIFDQVKLLFKCKKCGSIYRMDSGDDNSVDIEYVEAIRKVFIKKHRHCKEKKKEEKNND